MTGWIWALPAALCGGAAAFFLRSEWEKDHPVTTEYEIRSEKIPPEFDGTRLVYLTDLHGKEFGPRSARLLEAVRAAKPDMVLFGGDMMVAREQGGCSLRVTLELAGQLAAEYPVYYGFGNHELRLKRTGHHRETFRELTDGLRKAGVRVLDDMSVCLHGSGGTVTVTGLTLPREAYPKYRKRPLPEGFIRERVGTVPENDFRILLAHTPLYAKEYARWGAGLTLCGHYHGGTVILPVVGGLMSPDYHLFPRMYRGRYEEEGGTLLLSGGLGTHSVNIRFGNRPEIVAVRLRRTEPSERGGKAVCRTEPSGRGEEAVHRTELSGRGGSRKETEE